MKLNWFTPLPPAKTDIGHLTARVLPVLTKQADVTLWTTQSNWDPGLNTYAKVRRYKTGRVPWRELNRADMTIYNLGNNPLFHRTIWEISQRHPGVVVLHDYKLQELFYSLYLDAWQDLNAYLIQMEFYYGDEGRLEADAAYKRQTPEGLTERYPLTDLGVENALGVLVHTNQAFEKLNQAGHRPVVYAELPFTRLVNSKPLPRAPVPPHRLIIFGYLGANRRLEEVLTVLSEFAGQHQFQLDIFGEVSNSAQLLKKIKQHNLQKHVTFHGFVEESELEQALSAAHLAINLRYPTAGEASGSQLRIWSHALPSLVTRVDWYAAVPENTVRFVRPEHELSDLRVHFRNFFADPDLFSELGRNGFAHYKRHHLPEQYVEKLLKLVSEAIEFRAAATWQKLVVKARLEAANSFSAKLSNREWSEIVEWSRVKEITPIDEDLRQRMNQKASLVYGRTAQRRHRPTFFQRMKHFVKLHLPPRLYEYYVMMREGQRIS